MDFWVSFDLKTRESQKKTVLDFCCSDNIAETKMTTTKNPSNLDVASSVPITLDMLMHW